MRIPLKSVIPPAILFFVAMFAPGWRAQMISPSIDQPDQPFSYFSKPTDEIGLMGAEGATEITPEGYLRTGFEELMFLAGPDLEPTSVRIRTLEQGHLPIVHYEFERDGIVYRFTLFEARIDKSAIERARLQARFPFPSGVTPATGIVEPLVNFIRVELVNQTEAPNRAVFASAVRYDGPNTTGEPHGDNRFTRPAKGAFPGNYHQIGEDFDPNWTNSFDDANFYRNNRDLYIFPAGYADRTFTLRAHDNEITPADVLRSTDLNATPTTPIGIVTYSRLLKPGETWMLDFKMPLVPTADPFFITAIEQAGFDAAKTQVAAFWNDILASGMQIALPESKPVDTFYTNLIYDLMAIDHIGPDYIQTVNKLNYHEFYLRDGADIVHSYDITGYPQIARECLHFFAKRQQPDGNFLSQPQEYDGWGEAVWAYGQHYRITHDKDFAEWALPQIGRAVDWLRQARAGDPLHIVPASDVLDNEYVKGHITGYNFLALDGLQLAIAMAAETGHADLAQKWQAEYDDFHQAFFKVLDTQAAAHDGYIPPALDGQAGGFDWGNLLSIVPEPVLDPHDPRVTATLKATQAKYAEGITTYADGKFLHHYLIIKNTLTETIRGDQEQAIKEFYAILVHTSSTNAGFEFKIPPWGDRDFGDDLAPHGWFAAEYRTLLRAMLVREQGNQLHLLSVVSPAWIGKGKTIAVRRAPTNFGLVAFTLQQPSATEAVLKLDNHFDRAPKSIEVHLPWFVRLDSATVDGALITFARSEAGENVALSMPPTAREVHLRWTFMPNTPHLSYDRAVADYEAEYARRYQTLMHGEPAQKH
ncbi:MAG: hypothetical protein WB341_18270 [Terracidiphilus sp.]